MGRLRGVEEAGGRRQEAGGRRQEAGGRRQETGGRRQDAGGRRQEAGCRRQEAGGRWQGLVSELSLRFADSEQEERWAPEDQAKFGPRVCRLARSPGLEVVPGVVEADRTRFAPFERLVIVCLHHDICRQYNQRIGKSGAGNVSSTVARPIIVHHLSFLNISIGNKLHVLSWELFSETPCISLRTKTCRVLTFVQLGDPLFQCSKFCIFSIILLRLSTQHSPHYTPPSSSITVSGNLTCSCKARGLMFCLGEVRATGPGDMTLSGIAGGAGGAGGWVEEEPLVVSSPPCTRVISF
eukprot:768649-Hanusia_phi.AAC.1